jgi:hypothetical protein
MGARNVFFDITYSFSGGIFFYFILSQIGEF